MFARYLPLFVLETTAWSNNSPTPSSYLRKLHDLACIHQHTKYNDEGFLLRKYRKKPQIGYANTGKIHKLVTYTNLKIKKISQIHNAVRL